MLGFGDVADPCDVVRPTKGVHFHLGVLVLAVGVCFCDFLHGLGLISACALAGYSLLDAWTLVDALGIACMLVVRAEL